STTSCMPQAGAGRSTWVSRCEQAADRLEGDAHPVRAVCELVTDLVHRLGQHERLEHPAAVGLVAGQQVVDAGGAEVSRAEGPGDVLLPSLAEGAQLLVAGGLPPFDERDLGCI